MKEKNRKTKKQKNEKTEKLKDPVESSHRSDNGAGGKTKKQADDVSKEKLSLIERMASELLKLMGTKAEVEVKKDSDNDAILVDIQTKEETGLIIGNRGRTLNSIQTILGMMYRSKVGEWKRILVNVADWREKEETRLEGLAVQAAERAVSTEQEQFLYNLTSSQRRIVHMKLAGDKKVRTESIGEGKDRYLVIHPS